MNVIYGTPADLSSWMDLVERVSWNFPGLETLRSLLSTGILFCGLWRITGRFV